MSEYLVGLMYHEPQPFALWKKGVIEDYESSTGIFIEADSAEAAVAWGERIAQELLRYANNDQTLEWKSYGYICWIEDDPDESGWSHCLSFFQHVKYGDMPFLGQMGTEAYKRWLDRSAS